MGEYAEAKSREETIIKIAEACHEMNRAYCLAMGDTSQRSWADAPQWQKDSAKKGVELHYDNPDSTPADSHNSWLEEKKSTGWKFGPVKNPEKKEHPCFVPFTELPKEQQAKDFIFKATVDVLRKFR